MLSSKKLYQILNSQKINFFCGVPDSVLKNFTKIIDIDKKSKNIVCTNEGSAISLAIGSYLKNKSLNCVYMQNSGLGNAINPLISIADKNVYSIPLLLMIGWRGAPKQNDEPQHKTQGEITLKILKLLNINYIILQKNSDFKKIKPLLIKAKKKNAVVAIIIKNKSLQNDLKKFKELHNLNLIDRSEFLTDLIKNTNKNHRIISSTGFNSRELFQIRKNLNQPNENDFLLVGGMGHTSMVSLGISMFSKKEIICLDGDGSFLMHMGSILTFSKHGKNNLKYILLNNNVHESVGNQITNSNEINFRLFSKSFKFKNYFQIQNIKI